MSSRVAFGDRRQQLAGRGIAALEASCPDARRTQLAVDQHPLERAVGARRALAGVERSLAVHQADDIAR